MEEIVGSEAIQGEILEDARRKAARLLEEAEAEAERIVVGTEARAAAIVDEIVKTNEASASRFRMETMARFPLERTRMRTRFVDGKLTEAVGAYISALPADRVAALCRSMLERGSSFLAGKDVELRRRGVSEAAALEAAARALSSAASVLHAEDPSLPAPGFYARASDGSVLVRATMDMVEERLLDEKRGELAFALCAEALAL
jgi:V/A-type H+/Na+-transporting ATPase subunit E